MAKQQKYDLKGLRIIAAAYVVMALTLFGLQLSRVFMTNQYVEYGKIGLSALWWLLIMVGCIKLVNLSGEYVKALIASFFGLVFAGGEAFMLHRNLSAGMGDGAYTDVYVMFMFFMGICCLLYSMTKVLKAIGPMVERFALADEDVTFMALRAKEDEAHVLERLRGGEHVVLARGWEVIPVENLLAQSDNVLAEAGTLDEARLAAGILETGVAGIVVPRAAVAGLKHREIAALLEAPLPTVLSRYRRAIAKLRAALEKGEEL